MSNIIYNVVVSIINEVTGIDPEIITLDSHIVDDLQIDSFAITEIIGRFEEEFNITINATDFAGVYIIADIVSTLEELGATFDDSNIEPYADTSDTAYLSTENDIFGNGSKRVLTYKSMLELMYDENNFFKATSAINNSSIAPYNTEKLMSYGAPSTSYSKTNDSITINTSASNYKTFNTGLTHFVTTATMTITMSIRLAFDAVTIANTDGDETTYNISTASLDFDNEGTQTSSVEDTGASYTDNTMANTPALMSAGNNPRAIDDTLGSCEAGVTCNLNEYPTICGTADQIGACTPSFGFATLICETTSCSCGDTGETSGCGTTYKISYRATVYPIGSNTAIATKTATISVNSIFDTNSFVTTYIRIPAKKYFEKNITNTNAFGFNIVLTASTDCDFNHAGYTFENSTISYNRPTYYVFNPNDKTVRYATANSLYAIYTQ